MCKSLFCFYDISTYLWTLMFTDIIQINVIFCIKLHPFIILTLIDR